MLSAFLYCLFYRKFCNNSRNSIINMVKFRHINKIINGYIYG